MIKIRRFALSEEVKIVNTIQGIYKVIGYKQEIYNYRGKMMEHNKYCLECIDANLPEIWVDEEVIVRHKPYRINQDEVDKLLDDYNKNIELYHILKDKVYKIIADELIETLKQSQIK